MEIRKSLWSRGTRTSEINSRYGDSQSFVDGLTDCSGAGRNELDLLHDISSLLTAVITSGMQSYRSWKSGAS